MKFNCFENLEDTVGKYQCIFQSRCGAWWHGRLWKEPCELLALVKVVFFLMGTRLCSHVRSMCDTVWCHELQDW